VVGRAHLPPLQVLDKLAQRPAAPLQGLWSTVTPTFQGTRATWISRTLVGGSDEDVWRPVEAKLKEHGVKVELEPKRIHGNTDTVEFHHAWKNGRWHVYEPLSFDLADADNIKDKARRWLGHLSAVKVGATDDVQVHFIVVRPQSASLVPAYPHLLTAY
jgi:hypothetical protein